MKSSHFFILSLLLGVLFLTSCRSTPVEQRELYGLWKENDPDAEDTIEIKSDGTYLHKCIQKGLPDLTNSGTWELEPVDSSGYQRVSFKDFIGGSSIERKSGPGYFPPIVLREWSKIVIQCDADGELYYSK